MGLHANSSYCRRYFSALCKECQPPEVILCEWNFIYINKVSLFRALDHFRRFSPWHHVTSSLLGGGRALAPLYSTEHKLSCRH